MVLQQAVWKMRQPLRSWHPTCKGCVLCNQNPRQGCVDELHTVQLHGQSITAACAQKLILVLYDLEGADGSGTTLATRRLDHVEISLLDGEALASKQNLPYHSYHDLLADCAMHGDKRPLLKVPGGKKPAPEVQIYIRSGGRFPVALDLSGLAVTGDRRYVGNGVSSKLFAILFKVMDKDNNVVAHKITGAFQLQVGRQKYNEPKAEIPYPNMGLHRLKGYADMFDEHLHNFRAYVIHQFGPVEEEYYPVAICTAGELWEFLVNLEGAVRIGKVDAKLAEMVMNRFMLKEGQEVRGHLDKMMFPVDSLYVGQLWFGESANFEECFLFYSAPNGWVEWWDDPVVVAQRNGPEVHFHRPQSMYPAFLKELKNAARESWTAWKHSRQWRQVALKAAELTGFLDQYSSIGGTVFPVDLAGSSPGCVGMKIEDFRLLLDEGLAAFLNVMLQASASTSGSQDAALTQNADQTQVGGQGPSYSQPETTDPMALDADSSWQAFLETAVDSIV